VLSGLRCSREGSGSSQGLFPVRCGVDGRQREAKEEAKHAREDARFPSGLRGAPRTARVGAGHRTLRHVSRGWRVRMP